MHTPTTTHVNDSVTDSNRVYGLDIVRALAVLFVLVGHSFEHSKISPLIQSFGRLGILGVEIFFVLSGFLIGSIIMRLISKNEFHSLRQVSRFWQRRWLRTLPLYFVVLIVFLRFDYRGRHELSDFPSYFVFMQNFAYKIPDFFELSWSLAIEEHFYFWFPLFFLFWRAVTRSSGVAVLCTAFSFILIAYVFRWSQPFFEDWNQYNYLIRVTVLSRLDAIMFGVLMAALKYYRLSSFLWVKRGTPIYAALFVLLCFWWFVGSPKLMTSRAIQLNLFTVQAILCALMLPWFDGIRRQVSDNNFFVVSSKLAYSLYLTHILIIIFVNKSLIYLGLYEVIYPNPFFLYPIYFTLSYLVSWITYHRIEEPFLQLRDQTMTVRTCFNAAWFGVLVVAAAILFY